MNPDMATVTAYISTQRQSGYSDIAIYESLLASGWSVPIVQQALSMMPAAAQPVGYAAYSQQQFRPQPLNQPQYSTTGFFAPRLNRIGVVVSFVYVVGILLIPTIFLLIFRNSPTLNQIGVIIDVVGVVLSIPLSVSVAIRRWHDLGQSGFFALLGLIPFVGFIILFVYLLVPGTKGSNKFGEPDASPSSFGKIILGK